MYGYATSDYRLTSSFPRVMSPQPFFSRFPDELNSSPYSPSEVGSSVAGGEGEKRDFTPGSFKLPKKSLPSIAKRFTITAPAEHSHA